MLQEAAKITKRGLIDPERAAEILKVIPDKALDTQRKMNYFVEPRWKRLSEYEILTVYSQPTPDWIPGGLDWGDWTQKFHGGRPSWANEFTELHTTDWHRHRDPARRWHMPYVKDKAEEWRYTTRFLEAYSAEGQVRSIDTYWRDVILAGHYGALIYYEYAAFNAHSSVVRDCLGDTIRSSATFAALDKVDIAQMIQVERTFLGKIVPGFEESTAHPKQLWTTDPIYKGARLLSEELWQGIQDFNEILWSFHCVYDPLFGQFARREFYQTLAPHFGDSLTPFFINQAQLYHQTTRADMQDLYFHSLANDPQFGAYNKRFLRVWTNKYLPQVVTALKDFMSIYSTVLKIDGVSDKASVTAALERVFGDWAADYAAKIDLKVDVNALVASVVAGYK
jgi:methane monooxygenase component A beta chain